MLQDHYETKILPPDDARLCADCGTLFTLRLGEADFYAAHGYELPKRCPACLAYRRKRGPHPRP